MEPESFEVSRQVPDLDVLQVYLWQIHTTLHANMVKHKNKVK